MTEDHTSAASRPEQDRFTAETDHQVQGSGYEVGKILRMPKI